MVFSIGLQRQNADVGGFAAILRIGGNPSVRTPAFIMAFTALIISVSHSRIAPTLLLKAGRSYSFVWQQKRLRPSSRRSSDRSWNCAAGINYGMQHAALIAGAEKRKHSANVAHMLVCLSVWRQGGTPAMNNTQTYITSSLELHLFFGRIMKEHALFLKAGFLPRNINEIRTSESFLRQFEGLLSRAIALSNGVVRSCVLESGELFTPFTDCAEKQTQRLTGTCIDRSLTAREGRLRGFGCQDQWCVPRRMAHQVQNLNRDALLLVERLIAFKEHLLRGVGCCCLFTANYPLLIEHILREARLYRAYLLRLEGKEDCSCDDLKNSELFWNRIMMEHALFIRGLLDPSEEELIQTANGFAADFKRLLNASAVANDKMCGCNGNTLELTEKFRDFKQTGVQGIEACKIRSLILPLLADHVLREANHYIRILGE